MRVKAYYNLHRCLWSIVALEGPEKGRVVQHAKTCVLGRVTPKVSQRGRQRVIREKRKNVHSYLVGELIWAGAEEQALPSPCTEITYNPYKYTTFVRVGDEKQFHSAALALLQDRRVYVGGLRVWGTYDGLAKLETMHQ